MHGRPGLSLFQAASGSTPARVLVTHLHAAECVFGVIDVDHKPEPEPLEKVLALALQRAANHP
jgi:hypothetical protein